MVATLMKTNFRKLQPKIVHYRNYKNFTNELLSVNLVNRLSITKINTNDKSFDKFFKICGELLDRHTPPKKKYITGNQTRFKKLIKKIKK